MKLHLPSSLRKALLACLAALALPTFTISLGTGSAFLGGAALVSVLASQSAQAQVENWNELINEQIGVNWADLTAIPFGGDEEQHIQWPERLSGTLIVRVDNNHPGDDAWIPALEIMGDGNANLKLTGDRNSHQMTVAGLSGLRNFWLATDGASLKITSAATANFAFTNNVIVTGGLLNFDSEQTRGLYTGLRANFRIGGSSYTSGDPEYYHAALAFGIDVRTSGDLFVEEGSKIVFGGANTGMTDYATFSVNRLRGDSITSADQLTLTSFNNYHGVLEVRSSGAFGGSLLSDSQYAALRLNFTGGTQSFSGSVYMHGDLELAQEAVIELRGAFNTFKGKIYIVSSDGEAPGAGKHFASSRTMIYCNGGNADLDEIENGYEMSWVGGLRVVDATMEIYRNISLLDIGLIGSGNVKIGNYDGLLRTAELVFANSQNDEVMGNVSNSFSGTLTLSQGSTIRKQGQYEQALVGQTILNGSVVIEEGTLKLGKADDITLGESGTIHIYKNAVLAVESISAEDVTKISVSDDGEGYGILEWRGPSANDQNRTDDGLTVGSDLMLRLNLKKNGVPDPESWLWASGLKVNSVLELLEGEISFLPDEASVINKITSPEDEHGRMSLEEGANVTVRTDSVVGAWLDLRGNGTKLTLGGSLETRGGGLHTQNATPDSDATTAQIVSSGNGTVNLTLNVINNSVYQNDNNVEPDVYVYCGSINISGSLTKNGDVDQYIMGDVALKGGVLVNEATLHLNESTIGGGVVVNGGCLHLQGKTTITGDMEINNDGQVFVQYDENPTVDVSGKLRGNGGNLQIFNKTMTIWGGGTYNGTLSMGWSGALVLGANLQVAGMSQPEGYDAANYPTTQPSKVTAVSGKNVTFTINGGAGEEDFGYGVVFEESVDVVKTGEGEQRLRGVTMEGTLAINAGVLNFEDGENAVNGTLSGTGGSLQVSGSDTSLTIAGGGKYNGKLQLSEGGEVILDSDVTVGNLSSDSDTGNAVNGKGVLSVDVSENATMEEGAQLTLGEGVTLRKIGSGTWTLMGSLTAKSPIEVAQGTLLYAGGDLAADVKAQRNGMFVIALEDAYLPNTNVILEGGKLQTRVKEASLGTVTVSGSQVGSIEWVVQSGQRLDVTNLTGSGSLNVGTLEGTGNTNTRQISFAHVTNFSGKLIGSTSGLGRVYVGTVEQDAGTAGVIDISGEGAYSKAFRKLGAGSIDITKLTVEKGDLDGGLWMNYEGSLLVGTDWSGLTVESGVVLHYAGIQNYADQVNNTQLIGLRVESFLSSPSMKYGLNFTEVEGSVDGMSLGITGTGTENLNVLQNRFSSVGLDIGFSLYWVKNTNDDRYTLHLKVERFDNPENRWDPDWGTVTSTAPTYEEMGKHEILTEDVRMLETEHASFTRGALQLDDPHYQDEIYGRLIRITSGPDKASSKTAATVIGGLLDVTGKPSTLRDTDTWISLRPNVTTGGEQEKAIFSMLIGGSSCLTTTAGEVGGFVGGNTHIHMEGGEVDYIVGGNHLTNTGFIFEGNSYVAVFNGTVHGGIVGGSTITKGVADYDEFKGSSRITVHTVLGNDAGGKAPIIQDAGIVGSKTSFTAIVGGNAWIGVPNSAGANVNPSFYGSSYILVDLVNDVDPEVMRGTTIGKFEKAIVGGNYTVFTEDAGTGARSTTFTKDPSLAGDAATVIIRASEDAIFTAGVNGASRRASGGAGSTIFTGDTNVVLNGGTYTEAVAGGFWFEGSTSGDHVAELVGNTRVSVNGGNVWRAVGGSYSLGGGAGSVESHVGNTEVVVTGGYFGADYGPQTGDVQKDMSFVVGGNFYRDSQGSRNTHEGLSKVTITGGEFDNIHIVGGDYANFAAGTGCSSTITGGTSVSIGGAVDEELTDNADFSVHGLVVGGSYLTDTSTGGTIAIIRNEKVAQYGTEVIIGENAHLEAEKDPASSAVRHAGVAVVGGSVIMDEGTETGGHTASIVGGTHVVMTDGSVSGHVVGGSYANDSASRNTLSISGASSMELLGGTVSGNVYGGHYSDNLSTPDVLTMGSVHITVDGAEVEGNIVGGSYRGVRTGLPSNVTQPTQGAVEIDLLSGRVDGHVYAAGWHDSTRSSGLKVTTESTTVRVGADMIFGAAPAEDGTATAASKTLTVSGGFYKGSTSDASYVKGHSELAFVGNGSFDNVADIVFREFDTVNTVNARSNVTLTASQFLVRNNAPDNVFTKKGDGKLTLANGLLGANGSAYSGGIWVNGGILALGANRALDAGIGFDLNTRTSPNTRETAYLQGLEGVSLTAKRGTKLGLVGENLHAGTYYLTGELDGVSGLTAEDIFTWDKKALSWDSSITDGDKYTYEVKLKNDCLVLRVHIAADDKWYWEGGEDSADQVWDNTSENWSRADGHDLVAEKADVHFNAGALSGTVLINGRVTPQNIYVDSGSFLFEQMDGSNRGGLYLEADGKLIVGTENGDQEAQLELRLYNERIPGVVLNPNGTLMISHDRAIQSDVNSLKSSTMLEFNGGTLAYGENEKGALYTSRDFSHQVSTASTDVVRVQVGSKEGEVNPALAVNWGSEASMLGGENLNVGISHILKTGIEKSGRGTLNVLWTESKDIYNNAPYTGSICSMGGSLVFHLVNTVSEGVVFGAEGTPIRVADGANVQFIAEHSNGEGYMAHMVDIARAFERVAPEEEGEVGAAKGRVIIGSSDATLTNQVNYRLSGANAGYAGAIELSGREASDMVRVRAAESLGGENTTLVLSGRNVVMEAGYGLPTEIASGVVHVTNKTVTFLGYAQGDSLTDTGANESLEVGAANREITLRGKLEGSGVLANARGGITHTLAGDISEFTGLIVAGATGVGIGENSPYAGLPYSTSTWTLVGYAPESAELKASFGGQGSVIVAYEDLGEQGVLISGNIGGGSTYGDGTRLENRTSGKVIIGGSANTAEGALLFNGNVIQLGDADHAANWKGTLLREAGLPAEDAPEDEVETMSARAQVAESAFVLANGSLAKAIDAESKSTVLLKVDTAAMGHVSVAKTDGSMFDAIAVTSGGRLTDVNGDIVIGSAEEQTHQLVLGFDSESVGTSAGADNNYLIHSNGGDIDMEAVLSGEDADASISFDFTNDAFVKVLLAHRESEARTYLHVLSGGGSLLLGENGDAALESIFNDSNSYAAIIADLGFKYMGAEVGDIIMSGSSKEVYLVLGGLDDWKGDSHLVEDYNVLNTYKATVVDRNETLTVSVHLNDMPLPDSGRLDTDGLHINNLVGLEGSTLVLQNAGKISYEEAMEAYLRELELYESTPEAERSPYPPEEPVYEGDVTFVLDNSRHTISDGWALPDSVDTDDLKGIDTWFDGTILADEGTHVRKTGKGTLHVGAADGASGGMEALGSFHLEEGGLELRGAGSTIGSFYFAYADSTTDLEEDRALTVNGTRAVITDLFAEADDSYTQDNNVRLSNGGELVYTGAASTLHNLTITSDTKDGWFTVELDEESNPGALTLVNATVNGARLHVAGELNFTDGSTITTREVWVQGGTMNLEDGVMKADTVEVADGGTLDIHSTTGNTVHILSGDGTLKGAAGGELTFLGDRSSEFSGTLAGTLPAVVDDTEIADDEPGIDVQADDGVITPEEPQVGKGAKLVIDKGSNSDTGVLTFKEVRSSANATWDILNKGKWVVDCTEGQWALELGELTLASGSSTHLIYEPTYDKGAFNADVFAWEKGAELIIESSNNYVIMEDKVKVGTAEVMDGDYRDIDVTLRGLPFLHYEYSKLIHDNGGVYVKMRRARGNAFAEADPSMHKNALVGADLFWAATDPDSESYTRLMDDKNSDMFKMSWALTSMLNDGRISELENTLAAGAGASTAVLGSALTQDMQRQLTAIRNRTTSMGADPGYDRYNDKPNYHVWLNGEGSYHKLSSDGLAPGFTLSSWGGTVGVDMAFNRSTTVGVAVSAMYGNLKADAADSSTGDMDTTYVSLFARKAHGAWMHTLVMAGGLADISMNRTVNYGAGSYTGKSSTDGNMLGAMYELGYSKALNAAGSAVLQTVFNVEARHVQINAYTESGTDAGLAVEDIDHTVITFGAGVRAQAIVGESFLNRAAVVEGRVLAKFDAGDRSGKAITKLANGANVSGEVESAEIGAMGLELGAGVTLPVGVQGSLFFDASVELRSGYTSMDANIGYRVSF